jgi:hypothetical protein
MGIRRFDGRGASACKGDRRTRLFEQRLDASAVLPRGGAALLTGEAQQVEHHNGPAVSSSSTKLRIASAFSSAMTPIRGMPGYSVTRAFSRMWRLSARELTLSTVTSGARE